MQCDALLSPCRRYRYALWRRWGDGPPAMFIGLNPSTADDPTIRYAEATSVASHLD